MIGRPITFMTNVRKEQAEAGIQPSKRNIWPVVRGIVIALPIIAIFASLLASADVVFGQRLEGLINWFNIENLPELIFRFVYIVIIGYALAGVILHASTESKDEKLANEVSRSFLHFLAMWKRPLCWAVWLRSSPHLWSIQFQYFFGGTTNIHIDGYTYAEYARRGFGELVDGGILCPAHASHIERRHQTRNRNTTPHLFRVGRGSGCPFAGHAFFRFQTPRLV